MPTPNFADRDERVLVCAPFGRDAALVEKTLADAAVVTVLCESVETLLAESQKGVGAFLVTQEVLTPANLQAMGATVAAQPAWSDFPVLVFLSRGENDEARALRISQMLGNVTVLERPVSRFTLVSATQAALRARNRQYQVRDLLQKRENEISLRDQFLAMLGHELRNPLAAISHAVDVSRLHLPQGQAVPRPLQVMRRQCDHLARLVDDLLDVSRVTSGKVNLSPQAMDMRALVASAASPLEQAYAAQDIALSLNLGAQPLLVNADATRMEQVLTNLLTNALKYTPSGGRVDVSTTRDGDQIIVQVADTGVGLSEQMTVQVFELFVQSEGSLDRAQGGLGIGLTIARNLVELHGGTISARSEGEGLGSQFTVSLPRAVDVAKAPTASPPAATQDRVLRVLVVEDHDDNREGLKELIEAFGHRVDIASNGEEGLRRAVEGRHDVAIVDIGLPNLDGYQVAARLRRHLGNEVLLIALTGYGQPEDVQKSEQAGFDAHLTKPTTVEAMMAALRETPGRVPAR